jgi:hypothetical protein
MDLPQSSSGPRRLPACAAALLLGAVTLATAQTRLRAGNAAPFLKEPGGLRLGTLVAGASYPTGRSNAGHIETTVEGWIPAGSTNATNRDGFDLTVTAGGGEAVRGTPNGSIIARVQEGTLLSKIGSRGNWVRIRRVGWVARGALGAAGSAVAANPPPPPPPPPPPAAAAPSPPPATASPPSPLPSTGAVATDARAGELVSGTTTLRKGAELSGSPEGQRIAALEQIVDGLVVERQGDWVKVQVEGWVRATDLAADLTTGPRITGAMVRQQPDRFVGQNVTWRIQYLAVQEADDLRPEMPRGTPYVLARGPLPESGFVYLMLSKEQATEFRTRAPLDEVTVEAVIRAGRTRYLPTPVLSLVTVAR